MQNNLKLLYPEFPSTCINGVHLKFSESLFSKTKNKAHDLLVRKHLITEVVVLKLFPGISKQVVAGILNIPDLKGVVLETFGAGNSPNPENFIELFKNAIDKGIKIINVTQCIGGSVLLGHYDTSLMLNKVGVINGVDITTEAAIDKLMYLLNENLSADDFKTFFEKSLKGEITDNPF